MSIYDPSAEESEEHKAFMKELNSMSLRASGLALDYRDFMWQIEGYMMEYRDKLDTPTLNRLKDAWNWCAHAYVYLEHSRMSLERIRLYAVEDNGQSEVKIP